MGRLQGNKESGSRGRQCRSSLLPQVWSQYRGQSRCLANVCCTCWQYQDSRRYQWKKMMGIATIYCLPSLCSSACTMLSMHCMGGYWTFCTSYSDIAVRRSQTFKQTKHDIFSSLYYQVIHRLSLSYSPLPTSIPEAGLRQGWWMGILSKAQGSGVHMITTLAKHRKPSHAMNRLKKASIHSLRTHLCISYSLFSSSTVNGHTQMTLISKHMCLVNNKTFWFPVGKLDLEISMLLEVRIPI